MTEMLSGDPAADMRAAAGEARCRSHHRCYTADTHIVTRAANGPLVFTIMQKSHSRAFSWLKAPTSGYAFETLLRHIGIGTLTQDHKGWAGKLAQCLVALKS